MRISELAETTGVPVATIKFYLREGLLQEGVRRSATQADYSDLHAGRLRVIRALIESGVSVAETRRVIETLDDPPTTGYGLLAAAHAAVTPQIDEGLDLHAAEAVVARIGWEPGICDPGVIGGVALALQGLERAGFTPPSEVMTEYLDSIQRIARAEIAGVPTESLEAAVNYVVLGTVMVEPLLLALRRVAEQIASAERFGGASPTAAAPATTSAADS